jgi:Na+/H+ antiporter NhaC
MISFDTSASCNLQPSNHQRLRRLGAWLGVLVVVAVGALAFGQDTGAATQPATSQIAGADEMPKPPDQTYGAWVLIPPLVTIILAIALRQVIPALAVGVLIAAYLMVPCKPPPPDAVGGEVVWGLRLAVEEYLLGALASIDPKTGAIDYDHLKIIIFTLTIGGMVGVVAANGGTRAAVERLAGWASSRERGQLVAWFAGLIVFFDDYANAMIVGPSMRPMTDRLRISRAKLAYIVDSTAAPVSSIALIGTWVGAEISFISEGLTELQSKVVPEFLEGVTAYGAFMASIPYRFYAILALVMVFIVALLGRDFGPMQQAESEAPPPTEPGGSEAPGPEECPIGRAWYAIVPVLILVFLTMALLMVTGWPAGGLASVETRPEMPRWLALLAHILKDARANDSILYGALGSLVVAVAITLAARALTLAKCVEAATGVMARMLPTIIVLVLAWTLSAAMGDLLLGKVAVNLLSEHGFDAMWLPLLIFVSSCIVSFATGTSWGTMGILCPATVTISAGLLAELPVEEALPIFYAAVGAVLAGSVFGDHCSPISDTTVLSSIASECSLELHVWTQMPYALTVALVSMLCGDVLCRYCSLPWWVGLLTGTVALWLIVLIAGRKPRYAVS